MKHILQLSLIIQVKAIRSGWKEHLVSIDVEECYKEVESQAISYTTGVPAMCGALMLLTGKWTEKGVHTVEEFDPDPFLDALDKYGLPRSESFNPVLVD